MRRLTITIVVALVAVAANLQSAPSSVYVITGISVTELAAGKVESAANDINDAGSVVGWMSEGGFRRAFLHRAGQLFNLGVWWTEESSEASGINRHHEVVGYRTDQGVPRPVFWDHAGLDYDLYLIPNQRPCDSFARAINDDGAITGSVCYGGGMWPNWASMYQWMGVQHHGYDINNAGVMVGENHSYGLPAFMSVGVPPGGSSINVIGVPPPPGVISGTGGSGAAYGINNNNTVVGYYNDRAFIWDGASTSSIDLGKLPNGSYSKARGINDGSFVVGEADTAETPPPGAYSIVRHVGFIRHSHFGMRELPNLPNGGWVPMCGANAVNNRRSDGVIQVVGYCTVGGRQHAVRWDVSTSLVTRRPPFGL